MTATATTTKKKAGRPKDGAPKKRFYDGKLHAVLLPALPDHVEGGRLSPRKISESLECHRFTVYKWFNEDRLFPEPAKKLVALSNGRLTLEDLTPFVFA